METLPPMSGMEKMLHSLLRAAGFNPQQFAAGISTFIVTTQERLTKLEASLAAIDENQRKILQLLEAMNRGEITNRQIDGHDGNGNADGTGNDHGGSGNVIGFARSEPVAAASA